MDDHINRSEVVIFCNPLYHNDLFVGTLEKMHFLLTVKPSTKTIQEYFDVSTHKLVAVCLSYRF